MLICSVLFIEQNFHTS